MQLIVKKLSVFLLFNYSFIDGGVISTKFSSSTATVTFAYCMFMKNRAQYGGVMDIEHIIGTLVVAYSNMTKNLATNSKKHINIHDFNILF